MSTRFPVPTHLFQKMLSGVINHLLNTTRHNNLPNPRRLLLKTLHERSLQSHTGRASRFPGTRC